MRPSLLVVTAVFLLSVAGITPAVRGQEPSSPDSMRAQPPSEADTAPPTPELTVTADYPVDGWVNPNQPIRLRLNQPLRPEHGRLAVLLGPTDATALFTITETWLGYGPTTLLLPSGETQLTVYLVTPDRQWKQIGQFPLRVRTREGFQKAQIKPGLTLSTTGQLALGSNRADPNALRSPYPGVTFNTALRGAMARDKGALELQSNFLGVTHQDKALRFGLNGERAPKFDLSDYLLRANRGYFTGSLGHLSFGANRHLINSFGSRGVSGGLRIGRFADVSLAALNGNSIVGWGNPVGLSEADHRIYSATVGIEALPKRPGAARLDLTLLDGSQLPLTGINENEVNDAEQSRGWGLRFVGKNPSERVRLDAGYATSHFDNPFDPTLAQDGNLVPVRPTTNNARFLDFSYMALRELAITSALKANLTAAYRHERVDPLYRSIATNVQANLLQNVFELNGGIGPIALQASHTRAEDNLDDLASVLTTLTRLNVVNVGVPLGSLLRPSKPLMWLPGLTYSLSRTHQFGEKVPINSDFAETHVPDQVSTNQSFDFQWQQSKWRAGYRYNLSAQDNRQIGRERADLDNLAHTINGGFSPLSWLDVGAAIAFEGADNKELDQSNSTRRLGMNLDVRPTRNLSLAGALSSTWAHDEPRTSERDDTELSLEVSQNFRLLRRRRELPSGRVFLRFFQQAGSATVFADGSSGNSESRRIWALNSGVSFNAF